MRGGMSGLAVAMAAALAIAGAGCGTAPLAPDGGNGGSSGSGGSAGTSGSIPLEMFAADFAIGYCTPLVACGVFTDLATCRALSYFEQTDTIPTLVGEVGRGTVVYDPAAAATCVAALPTACNVNLSNEGGALIPQSALDLFQVMPACAGVFEGTLPTGAACELQSLACAGASAGTSHCSPGPGNCSLRDGCCVGTCQPTVATRHQLGETCTDTNLCQPPALCESTCVVPPAEGAACDASSYYPCLSLADYCSGGTCIPRLGVGAACTLSTSPSGQTIDPCQLDAHCADDGSGSGVTVCVRYAALGAACDATHTCPRWLGCENGVCAGPSAPAVDCGD